MSEHLTEHVTEQHFAALGPLDLYVETGSGTVTVHALETTESRVVVTGRDAEQVRVEQSGGSLSVIAPKRSGFLSGGSSLDVDVTVPTRSEAAIRTGSADVIVEGVVAALQVRSGSGEVRVETLGGPGVLETGSGDVHVEDAHGDLQVKSGSGEVRVARAAAQLAVSTGSGDVEIEATLGPTTGKTGSGDLHVREAGDDLTLTTGSGDLVLGRATRGRLTLEGASSDVRVGIPAGTPVWTDVVTLTGGIHNDLASAGAPVEGADHIELRVKTVSGDVVLHQA